MAACRPRSIESPLLLALGVALHQQFRSKHLCQTLSGLGMTASYEKVLNFEKVAAMARAKDTRVLRRVASMVQQEYRRPYPDVRWYLAIRA